jgi:tripeptide aminopeptidase
MLACFEAAAEDMSRVIDDRRVTPRVRADVRSDFPSMSVPEDAMTVQLARSAAQSLGQELKVRLGGGGSDANIFNGRGIEMIILATGMHKVHTHDESVAVADMVRVAELLVEIIRQAGSANPEHFRR